MVALAGGIRQALTAVDHEAAAGLRVQLRIIAATPSLRGAIERNSEATVEALVDALGTRGVTPLKARIAATAVIAGLSVALLDWAQSDDLPLAAALGSALDVLGGDGHVGI